MVAHPFRVDGQVSLKEVSYEVGYPPGTYSSWSSFALARHFCV